MPIIQNILMRVIPVVTKLIEDLMPSIIQILEGLGPIIDRIMDILIPIIEALVPLLVAINEIIIELLPLIEMILRIVRGILPIITAVIRAVVKIVKALGKVVGAIIDVLMPILEALLPYIEQLAWLIGNVIDAIVAFPDWLNTTFGPVLEGIWQLLTDLVSFEGLEGIVTMLYDIWNVIVNIGSYIYFAVVLALESLWAKLEEVFQDIVKAVEGLVGGALGGGGPNVLDPTTWHDGGPVAAADLITLPGMKQNEGLAVLEDGEHVISKDDVSGSGLNINFYVTALNPREQTEEIRQLLEELFLAGKLRVS